jgi:hypothetical protein
MGGRGLVSYDDGVLGVLRIILGFARIIVIGLTISAAVFILISDSYCCAWRSSLESKI